MKTITITTVTVDSPSPGKITIVGDVTDETFGLPSQRVTIENTPTGNPAFSRAVAVTEESMQVQRNGANPVALDIPSWAAKVSTALEATLATTPYVTVDPANITGTFAKATLTSTGTNVSNNDTVTLGGKTYTFKTTLTPTEGEVLIGASAAASLDNLALAVNRTDPGSNDGVKYKVAAAHTQVYASTNTDTTQLFISLTIGTAANAYASTEVAATLSFGPETFAGGTAAPTFAVTSVSELTQTYQWQVSTDSGGNFSNISGGIYSNETTATLTVTPTSTTQNGYLYRCVVTNSRGTVYSASATLTLN